MMDAEDKARLREIVIEFQRGCVDTKIRNAPAWKCATCFAAAVRALGRIGIPADAAAAMLKQDVAKIFPEHGDYAYPLEAFKGSDKHD